MKQSRDLPGGTGGYRVSGAEGSIYRAEMNLYNESGVEIICILRRQVLITRNDLRLTIPQSLEC